MALWGFILPLGLVSNSSWYCIALRAIIKNKIIYYSTRLFSVKYLFQIRNKEIYFASLYCINEEVAAVEYKKNCIPLPSFYFSFWAYKNSERNYTTSQNSEIKKVEWFFLIIFYYSPWNNFDAHFYVNNSSGDKRILGNFFTDRTTMITLI